MDEKNDLYELCFSRKAVHRRRRRRVKLRRLRFAVVLCFFAVVLCVGVGQLLAVQTVKSIVFTGQQHYSDAILADKLSVQVGDAMYGVDTEGVTEKLLSSCPYLATVEIKRSLRGVLTVHMTQRDARYALCVDEGGYLLLDEHLTALEFVSGIPEVCVVVAEGLPSAVPGERLAMTAAALEARAKEQRAEAKAAGEDVSNFVIPDYSGPVAVLTTRLEELAAAYASIDERQAPMRLDMSNRFALVLWLRDGTRIDLGNSTQLKNKYASAMQAIARYLERHPEYDGQGEIRVDVSDLSSVLVSYKTIN